MLPHGNPRVNHRISLPLEPGDVRRRTAWHRVWGLCAALLGVAGLAIVPDLIEDEKAFGTATACTTPSSPQDDCLRSFDATVTRTVIREQNKSSEYTLYLDGPARVPRSIDMGDSEPLLKRLRPGDNVTVTIWRDYATEVRQGNVSQETADTPEGEPVVVCALALAAICGGAYGLHAGGTTLARARRHAVRGLPATLVTRGKEAAGAALCVLPALVVGDFTNVPLMLVVWLGLLPLVRWVVQRQQRSTGRHARRPCTRPDGPDCEAPDAEPRARLLALVCAVGARAPTRGMHSRRVITLIRLRFSQFSGSIGPYSSAPPCQHHLGGSSWTCDTGGVMITRVSGGGPAHREGT
jgi:hypothetical protein